MSIQLIDTWTSSAYHPTVAKVSVIVERATQNAIKKMHISAFVSVLLMVSVPLTHGFLTRLRRVSEPSQSYCQRTASACAETYFNKFPRIRHLSDVQQTLSNRTFVAEMSVSLQEAAECLDSVAALPMCHSVHEWSDIVKFISDFISSPGTIDKIVAAAASPCLSDMIVYEQFGLALEQCWNIFEQAVDDQPDSLCGSFSQLWQCVEEEVTQACGAAYADLFNSWKQFVLSPTRGPNFLAWLTSKSETDFASCEHQLIVTYR
ncbi:hypothetical protein RRG08_022250 [Elysia crispata]|uniref:Uncharacterized protein n=1 Tax=Elysia crispata TaxID=231223 RepID=A0AAE0ZQN5_9GAST|nr:hypothetical protein RRG08_022250 [Elysia crispata]